MSVISHNVIINEQYDMFHTHNYINKKVTVLVCDYIGTKKTIKINIIWAYKVLEIKPTTKLLGVIVGNNVRTLLNLYH